MTSRQMKISLVSSALIVVLGVLLIVTGSFAWLDVSRIPFVSDVDISVITDNDLVIAPDAEGGPLDWSTCWDASELTDHMVKLKPITYKDGGFFELQYDEDGRTAGVIPVTEDKINRQDSDKSYSSAGNSAEEYNCLLELDFWLRTNGSATDVWLKSPKEIEDGQINRGCFAVGTPQWSEAAVGHMNNGYGAESTIRIGFDIETGNSPEEMDGNNVFFIYEPNANIHPGGQKGYLETERIGGGPQIDNDHLLIQDASEWEDADDPQEDKIVYKAGQFTQNRKLFSLDGDNMAKIKMYIWMEGQDPDCYALSYTDVMEILANIEFGSQEKVKDTGISRD